MHGPKQSCYPTSFSGQLVLHSLSCYATWPEFFCMFCHLGKLPLRMSRVFYRTVLWVIMIYNSETTCSISWRNFQEISAQAWKTCLQNFVVQNGCYGNRNWFFVFLQCLISQQGVKLLPWHFVSLFSRTKGTVHVQNIFSSDLQIFSYNAANFQRGSSGCTGLNSACYPSSFSRELVLDRLSRHSCADDFCISC